jgi:hypothetical protein
LREAQWQAEIRRKEMLLQEVDVQGPADNVDGHVRIDTELRAHIGGRCRTGAVTTEIWIRGRIVT